MSEERFEAIKNGIVEWTPYDEDNLQYSTYERIAERMNQLYVEEEFLFAEKNVLQTQNKELQERNNRQANTIAELSEKVDNFIDFKGRLDGKIQEYTTKSEEYELSACGCGARINAYKKQALEELKEELFK